MTPRDALRTVVSNLDPRRTFLRLVDPMNLEPGFLTRIRNYRVPGTTGKVNFALGRLPAFRGIAAFPAPFLGGLMYDHFGYEVPILANLVGAAVVTATIYVVLRDPPSGGVEASLSVG